LLGSYAIYAYLKVGAAARTHDRWKKAADRYGLESRESSEIDAPELVGDYDGRSVRVRPVYKKQDALGNRGSALETTHVRDD
ncbi:MAG: hypothetical protein ABEK29_05055, partial [Bradymonadaceae bacterium]